MPDPEGSDLRQRALAILAWRRPKQFEVLKLHIEGKREAEIAEKLGVTQGNVSQAIKRGYKTISRIKENIIKQNGRGSQ